MRRKHHRLVIWIVILLDHGSFEIHAGVNVYSVGEGVPLFLSFREVEDRLGGIVGEPLRQYSVIQGH